MQTVNWMRFYKPLIFLFMDFSMKKKKNSRFFFFLQHTIHGSFQENKRAKETTSQS
jgi:hypothetical protein